MMSIWDRFGGQMRWTYEEPDLTGQDFIGTWPASAADLQGAGRLLLTDKAITFCPADLEQTKKLLSVLTSAVEIPGSDVLAKAADLGRDSLLVIPLANIASAEQVSQPRVFKAPKVRITTKVGSAHEFGVLAGTGYPNIHPRNNEAVADLLAKLQPLITP
jgi:hypothetical protein